MVGRKVERSTPTARAAPARSLLEVRDLRRLPTVRGVSFEVRAGEVLGLGGLVGSGRSELLRLIYGIDRREAGEVLRRGQAPGARTGPTGRSPPASASRPRTASPRGCCSTGA